MQKPQIVLTPLPFVIIYFAIMLFFQEITIWMEEKQAHH